MAHKNVVTGGPFSIQRALSFYLSFSLSVLRATKITRMTSAAPRLFGRDRIKEEATGRQSSCVCSPSVVLGR